MKPLPAAAAERYLELTALHYKAKKQAEIVAEAGISASELTVCRNTIPGFRERETRARTKALARLNPKKPDPAGEEGLSEPYRDFLHHLRATDDRVEAADLAEIPGGWPAVEEAAKSVPALARGIATWRKKVIARLEDRVARKGVEGDTSAARAYLSANDPRYRRQLPEGGGKGAGGADDAQVAAIKKEWRDRMGASSAAPPLEVDPDDEDRLPDA